MNVVTVPDAAARTSRTMLAGSLAIAVLALIAFQYETFRSLVDKWSGDAAFSHGFLILPISVWLAWSKRAKLVGTPLRPAALGVVAMLLCVLAWVVARGSGVLVIEQLAVVAMIPALVLAALGWPATRVILVPLAFLFFMVPFGRGLVPALMQVTADFSVLLLQWTGVPVYRTHMHISIPSGSFEVARACSGLNYFITSMVLGCLYGYVNFRSWPKRAACVAAFLIIPVILNGLRVYFTILVSHLTEMRFGPGTEHVTFGRIFFVAVMLVLFWIGRRWHEDMTPAVDGAKNGPPGAVAPWATWWPLPLACLLALAGPPFVASSIARASERLADREGLVTLPLPAASWRGPLDATGRWRPQYSGGLLERQAIYEASDGRSVDVFVGVFGLGATAGAEMISYNNMIAPEERGHLAQEDSHVVTLADGISFEVREVLAANGRTRQLVWYWFVVGERPALNPFVVKALESLAFVTRRAETERIVAISTAYDESATRRLGAFIQAHGRCVIQGFPVEACRG